MPPPSPTHYQLPPVGEDSRRIGELFIMNKHCSRRALPIPHCCIPRSFQLRGKCPEIWIYFPYFSSRFGFSFFFVSFLWKKHLSPCKVTLLISLCASSHCCLLMYPKDSQSTRDCDVSGMSLSVLLPPPLPACNLIYSCDAFFAVWHACSVLICDIIWGSIRVRKKGRRLVTVTISIELSAMLQARGNATF